MRCLVFLLVLLSPLRAAATIAYVNGASGTEISGTATTTVASGAFNVSAGNHLVVFFEWTATNPGSPTVSGTGGDTFTDSGCGVSLGDLGAAWFTMWYHENPTANANYVVTVTWPAGVDYKFLVVIQQSGVAASNSLDACVTDTGLSSVTPTCTSNQFTTTTANQVLVTGAYQNNNSQTWSAGGSATLRLADSLERVGVQTQVVSAIQTAQTASMVSAGSGDGCNVLVATFKEAAASTISYVNGTSGSEMSGGSSTTQTATAFAVTAGNHIAVGVRWSGSGTAPTVTDTAGNTYTESACGPKSTQGNMSDWLSVFYAQNITGHATNVITVTWGAGVNYRSIVALQRSGVATTSSADQCVGDNGSQSSPTCTTNTFTTTQADEELATFAMYNWDIGGTWTAGGSATLRVQDASFVQASQTQVVSAIQTNQTASMTAPQSSVPCTIIVVTFKAGFGGPPPGVGGRRHVLWGIN